MPVISPRRSSATSGSFYVSPSTTSGTTDLSGRSSYLDRGNSLSKASSTSYSSTYGYLGNSSYSSYLPPRASTSTSTYRSSLGASSSSSLTTSPSSLSSYSSGGISKFNSYRSPNTYYNSNNDSTLSSRYGTRSKLSKDPLKNDGNHDTSKTSNSGSGSNTDNSSKSNNNRLSSSYSSSSLARLVATSGLDIYEKYSPAHYIPKCELPRSRSSVSEATVSTVDGGGGGDSGCNNKSIQDEAKECNKSTRPTSRYSRFISARNNDEDGKDESDGAAVVRNRSSNRASDKLVNSSSSSSLKKSSSYNNTNNINVSSTKSDRNDTSPIPTYTIRTNRLKKSTTTATNNAADDDGENALKNGSVDVNYNRYKINNNNNNNSTDSISTTRNHFKDLKLSSSTSSLSSGVKDCKDIITTELDTPTATATITITNCSNGFELNSSNNNSGSMSGGDVSCANSITSTQSKLDNQLPSNNSKARSSSSLRSALPPPSPATSRYWDRESNRTSSSTRIDDQVNSKPLDEKSEGLCGLRNIGNTCFMNSVIQCLSHTSELTKFLRTQNGIKSPASRDQQILYEFAKLIREMWTANVHSVTPMELKRAFSTKHRMYSDYNQQDAQEFLRFFLDSLHCALNTGVKGGEGLKIDDNLSDNKKADLTWEWYTRHENSLIRDLFVGQLKSTLKCTTCGNTSVTFDPFWDLSVSLPSSSRCKLDACLDLFIREEVLDGDEMPTCSKCQTRRKCTKSFSIQRFPKYLVIHLKRFSETRWSKLSNIVEFPSGERELNMGPYGSNHSTSVYYSLYAISNHMGSTAGGHYVALCKHPVSKKWHEFNDNIVSDDLSENHLVSSSAYILFYERA